MRTIPEPTYRRETDELTTYYTKAMRDIEAVLMSIDLSATNRAAHEAKLKEIRGILADLDAATSTWIKTYMPAAVLAGIAGTLYVLSAAETLAAAVNAAKFNRVSRTLADVAMADLQDDLLAVTQNVERRVRTGIRQATAEAMRSNLSAGRNNNVDISRDILANSRRRLGATLESGIVDAAGRKWKPEVYAKMVARTKLQAAQLESTQAEAVSRGAYYGIISSHGAKDYCRFHEGRIVKLTPDAPGSYPTVDELKATGQIWHPNCKHQVTPVRDAGLLPQAVRTKANQQAERGDQASQLGRTVRAFKEID